MAFAILAGSYIADWAYRKYFLLNDDMDLLLNLVPWLVIVGFAGARIYYCVLNFHYYIARPLDIFNVREGGLSIHGTLLACALFLIIYAKKKKFSFFELAAPMTLGLALAQSIGRWGNFFNSEAFGRPLETGLIKLYIPEALRPLQYKAFEYFHPTFLYESVLDFGIFLVLFVVLRKNRNPMFITSLYFALYSIVRILVETLRVDSVANPAGIPLAIYVSAVLLVVSLIGITKSKA